MLIFLLIISVSFNFYETLNFEDFKRDCFDHKVVSITHENSHICNLEPNPHNNSAFIFK